MYIMYYVNIAMTNCIYDIGTHDVKVKYLTT